MLKKMTLLPLILILSLMATDVQARQKNHKRQIVDVGGILVSVQRVDRMKKNGRIIPSVVYLSYRNPPFKRASTKVIRMDTTGVQLIKQRTGCTPLPGLIPANTFLLRKYSYVEVEVTCP